MAAPRRSRPGIKNRASAEARADRATAGLGDLAEARDALADHHADHAPALALHAHRLVAQLRPATFTLRQYTLTTTVGGTGPGTITSNPVGITCGADCTEVYNTGQVVTLTATPTAGGLVVPVRVRPGGSSCLCFAGA